MPNWNEFATVLVPLFEPNLKAFARRQHDEEKMRFHGFPVTMYESALIFRMKETGEWE